MLVAASTQTTPIISLKRSTATKSWDYDGRPNIPSDSLLMKLRRRFGLVSERNQRHALSSRLEVGPAWVFGG
jgi:hypothetical protein